MIEDARILRDEFVPRTVRYRDQEVNQLTRTLNPRTLGESAETSIITGPSGAGKTCIARYTAEQLREERRDTTVQYVNCWQHYSRFKALYTILDGLGKSVDIHRQSTPHDELIERLHQYDGPPVVVILDEVDQLEEKALLYDLYTLREFHMILIANREVDLFGALDERLNSRLRGSKRIQFDRYNVAELVAILEKRAKWGLTPGAVNTPELEHIADEAAGDARVAITILRSAARHAEEHNVEQITKSIIRESIPSARNRIHEKSLEELTPHQRTIYDIIDDSDGVSPKDVYERYQDEIDEPKTDRTVRKYLQKMLQYDLIEAEGTSRDRIYDTPEVSVKQTPVRRDGVKHR